MFFAFGLVHVDLSSQAISRSKRESEQLVLFPFDISLFPGFAHSSQPDSQASKCVGEQVWLLSKLI